MMQPVQAGWEEINNLVAAAQVPEASKQTTTWCLRKLPDLCESFAQTYESRYAEEIIRLERAILASLADPACTPADLGGLKEAVMAQLIGLHERLGLPEPQLVKPRPAATGSRGRKPAVE
jgi:hypothetical protein